MKKNLKGHRFGPCCYGSGTGEGRETQRKNKSEREREGKEAGASDPINAAR